jgi:hypothetical protein
VAALPADTERTGKIDVRTLVLTITAPLDAISDKAAGESRVHKALLHARSPLVRAQLRSALWMSAIAAT